MKKVLLTAIAAGVTFVAVAPADAAQGCGRGYNRGPRGGCRPNGAVVVRRPVLVIGQYYRGQGYWDGRRYWRERYRYHNGWRYR